MSQLEPSQNNKDAADKVWLVLLIFGSVVVAQLILGLVIYRAFDEWPERGTFGDMFGAVNTLFSGLAFAGIVYAILLQRRELMLQRNELELTRAELERSAEAQEKSSHLLAEQLSVMRTSYSLAELRALAGSRPILLFAGVAQSPTDPRMEFTNEGATVTVIAAEPKGDFTAVFSPMGLMKSGIRGSIDFHHGKDLKPPYTLEIRYLDSLERRRSLLIECDPLQGRLRVVPEENSV